MRLQLDTGSGSCVPWGEQRMHAVQRRQAHLLGSVGSFDVALCLTPPRFEPAVKLCRLSSSVTGRAANGTSAIDGSRLCVAPALAASRLRMSRDIATRFISCVRTGGWHWEDWVTRNAPVS